MESDAKVWIEEKQLHQLQKSALAGDCFAALQERLGVEGMTFQATAERVKYLLDCETRLFASLQKKEPAAELPRETFGPVTINIEAVYFGGPVIDEEA